jgi:hypothetical protein
LHAGTEDGSKFGSVAALAALADFAKITTGTKSATGSGEDHDVDGVIVGDANEGLIESVGKIFVEGVETSRAIHHQSDDGALSVFEDYGR